MKYFLCRFVPPGPDFLKTMTPEQKVLMKAHGDYLQALLVKGIVLSHGPVADPAGGWGMSLFEMGDDKSADDVRALTAEDPMIKANIGARYEVLPMLQLRKRG
ncbi:MAG: YciI family protein [Pseudomonadota bacterium]